MIEDYTSIGSLLTKRAELSPDKIAYVDGFSGFQMSFADLDQRCNNTAAALLKAGVSKGDRVALLLMNGVEFIESFMAVAKIGGVVVPLNWRLTANELQFILHNSGAKTLIYSNEFARVVADLHARGDGPDGTMAQTWWQVCDPLGVKDQEAVAPQPFASSYEDLHGACAGAAAPTVTVEPEDHVYIMYTSGTTGLPKGATHTHASSFWSALTIAATADNRVEDHFLSALPMFHVGALTPLTMCIYMGITCVVMRNFNPVEIWQIIEREKITTGLLVPAMLNFMLHAGDLSRFDYSSVRWIMSGASPLPVSLIHKYLDLGLEIQQVYGLTETGGPACIITGKAVREKLGSTGKAFFHTRVRIVNEEGKDCAPGEPGEVLVAGRHLMKEYWKNPAATAETLKNGWLHTGDIATLDEDGFVYVRDRIKDMIISGGENVYPAEIENVLLTHPDVAEVAVIGQPSKHWGESPFAVVAPKNKEVTQKELLTFCRDKLARYKHPQGVAFIDVLPRNPSGKVLKRVLREKFPGPTLT